MINMVSLKKAVFVGFLFLVLVEWNPVLCVTASISPTISYVPSNASSVYSNSNWTNPNATNPNATSTPTTGTPPVTLPRCFLKKTWKDNLVDTSCKSVACASDVFANFDEHIICNEKVNENEVNDIASEVFQYASSVATSYTDASPASILGNGSVSFSTNNFMVEVGYLNRDRSDLREWSVVPNYGVGGAMHYSGKRDIFKLSMVTLNPGVTKYYIASHKNLIPTTRLLTYTDDIPSILTKLEEANVYRWPKTRAGKWVINSEVVQIGLNPLPEALTESVEVTLHHKVLIAREDHACITYTGSIDNVHARWTRSGCHQSYTDRFKTVCKCENVGTFAVIAKVTEDPVKASGFSRTFFSQLAMGVSGFIMLGLVCSIIYAHISGCFHLLRVKIHFFHDIACFMVYFSFLVGVMLSHNLTYADSAASCIHFFQTAVISWLVVEGIHNYHTINNVYDPEVTSPLFFYSTIGWGIPAALSGACAGYPYNLGTTTEFTWMKVSGSGMAYFAVGPVVSTLAVFLMYALLFYELSSWIGSKHDYVYRRSIEFVKRSGMLLLLAILTWYTGIMARNSPDKLSFHYLFLAMYGTQGAAFVYLHSLRNTEIAEHKASLKSSTKDGSISGLTEEDQLSMQSSMRWSQLDFKSEASLKSKQSESRAATALSKKSKKSGDEDDSDDEGSKSGKSTHISRRSSSSSSSSSSDSDDEGKEIGSHTGSRRGSQRGSRSDFSAYQIEPENDQGIDNAGLEPGGEEKEESSGDLKEGGEEPAVDGGSPVENGGSLEEGVTGLEEEEVPRGASAADAGNEADEMIRENDGTEDGIAHEDDGNELGEDNDLQNEDNNQENAGEEGDENHVQEGDEGSGGDMNNEEASDNLPAEEVELSDGYAQGDEGVGESEA